MQNKFILFQVATIMVIAGALRSDELVTLTIDEIKDLGSTILVSVMNTKNYVNRTFTTVSKKIVQLILLQYVKNTWLCGKKQQSIDVFLSVIRITNVPHRPRAKTLLENCLGK
jgi:hypothetical protein